MVDVQVFSKGKSKDKNDDYFGYNDTCFVIADGSTDKSGKMHEGKTGGELASYIIVNECLSTNFVGVELINHLNRVIKDLYASFGILKDIKDPKYRFACNGFVCVRLVDNKMIVTSLGDSGFRINGAKVYQGKKQADVDASEKRAEYIKRTGDVEGSRKYILPFILENFKYQNNPDDNLGFGSIDGTDTPAKFVKNFEYSRDQVKTIELFTDGYFDIPQKVSIEAWEKVSEEVEREDPNKCKKYKSTKSKDDRTVAIIRF